MLFSGGTFLFVATVYVTAAMLCFTPHHPSIGDVWLDAYCRSRS
jgi:hypothetical protein